MRADRRADDVVRVGRVTAPVADCLVRGVLQRHVARSDRAHFGAQHFHFLHIRVLTFYVGLAHVDDAPHVFQRADRSGSHTVLPCARFGDDTGFAHLLRDQNLSDRIVDLVRSGMVQVFAFEVDPAAVPFGQAPCEIERGRATDIVAQQLIEFAAERFRLHNGQVVVLQFFYASVKNFGNVSPAEPAVIAVFVYLKCFHRFRFYDFVLVVIRKEPCRKYDRALCYLWFRFEQIRESATLRLRKL